MPESVPPSRSSSSSDADGVGRSALLIVDVQNDFCSGGALAVPQGDRVVPVLNLYIERATALGWPIYASRDWHPAVTSHFEPYGGPWPPHCVQGTAGARFHAELRLPAGVSIVTKGDQAGEAGYSPFDGHTADGSALLADLRARGIDHLYIGGLATDYCVKHAVLDALAAGLTVTLLADAIAGVEVSPGDSASALDEMRDRGARIASLAGSLG